MGAGGSVSGNVFHSFSDVLRVFTAKLSGYHQYIWENVLQYLFFKKLKYKKVLLVKLPGNTGCSPFQQAE